MWTTVGSTGLCPSTDTAARQQRGMRVCMSVYVKLSTCCLCYFIKSVAVVSLFMDFSVLNTEER